MPWWEDMDGPIHGRYRIDRLLGEGGMARVFLATDLRARRPVAFKTPKIESFPPESVAELLGRFNREFDAQASDPVQGVIPIYESGEFTDAASVVRPFLAMQYLSGGSLGDLLGGTIGRRERTQTLAELLEWLVPIARTLDRLHARRYLHRDVKPDNILFNSDGDPFLADLGIVGSLDPALSGSILGSTSMGVLGSPGSPGYQSPESILAEPNLRNISASDQFSLAVTVYEALAGRLPANASTNQQWYGALLNWAPVPLSIPCPELARTAVEAVMKAMSARSRDRFASCSEFAKALSAAASSHDQLPAAVPTLSPVSHLPPPTTTAPQAQAAAGLPALQPATRAWIGATALSALLLTTWMLWGGTDGTTGGTEPVPNVIEAEKTEAGLPPQVAAPPATDSPSAAPTPALPAVLSAVAEPGESVADATAGADAASAAKTKAPVNPKSAACLPGDKDGCDTDAGKVRPAARPLPVAPIAEDRSGDSPEMVLIRRCHDDQGQFDAGESIRSCTKLIEALTANGNEVSLSHRFRGQHRLRAGDFPNAERDFTRAIELSPNGWFRAASHELRGKARNANGQTSAGETDLAMARQLRTDEEKLR